MIFTENDYKKIQKWLTQHSLKDSDFSKIELEELNEEINNVTVPVITYSVPNNTYNNNLVSVTDLDTYYSPLYLRKDHNYTREEKPFATYWSDENNKIKYKAQMSAPVFYSITKRPDEDSTFDESPIIELTELTGSYANVYGGSVKIAGWETNDDFELQNVPTLKTYYNYNGVRIDYDNTTEIGLGIGIPNKLGFTDDASRSDTLTGLYIGYDPAHSDNKRGVFIEGQKDNDVLNAQGGVRKDFTSYIGAFNQSSGYVENNILNAYDLATNKEVSLINYQCANPYQSRKPLTILVQQNVTNNGDGTTTSYQKMYLQDKQVRRTLKFSDSDKTLISNTNWKSAPKIKTYKTTESVDTYNDVIIDTRVIAE